MSIQKLVTNLNVHRTTVLRATHEDLRYKRLEKCELLIPSSKHGADSRIRFFSNEKIFYVDAKINRQNDRWICKDPAHVPVIGATKFPTRVHVLVAISSEGDVMSPHSSVRIRT